MKLPLPVIVLMMAAAMCLFAMAPGMSYGYFMLLRCAVFAAAVIGAVQMKRRGMGGWMWSSVCLALLFNPFLRVHLSREIWWWIDAGAAVFLAIVADKIRNVSMSER